VKSVLFFNTLLIQFFLLGFLTFAHIALVSAFGENIAKRLRSKLFAAIIQQDLNFFDNHRSGELVSRLTADAAEFKVK
jgi:ATP-binding cassette subfamily B (MDR/TAP) protein 8